MWADVQPHGRPAEYWWRRLRKFRNSITRRKVWLMPGAGVPCSNAANIGERKTWTQVKFARGKIPSGGKSRRKCIV